ncbi:NfeD family protein [Marinoscillum sp.]|uniref:NfeD family protein n=1 Tax=Marinoscillum sp. TaxID=2024838 RepID=UPI003BA94FF1
MEWISVLALIILGIALIVVEVIFVPGTTIVGIMGFVCGGVGIYLGYDYFGPTTGTIIMVFSVLLGFGVIFYSFKSRAWERFSLKGEHRSKYNDGIVVNLQLAQRGKTISSLKPYGKAMFDDQIVEVKSNGAYISENQQVEITKLDSNKIIVKPI